MNDVPFPLAVSLGDPAGIGPEIIGASYARLRADRSVLPFLAVGGTDLLRSACERAGIDCPIVPIAQADEAASAFAAGLPVLAGLDAAYTPGEPSELGARLAKSSLEWATQLALLGEVSAMVTAAACNLEPDDAVMMLAGPSLRTVPLTIHVALADVPALVTTDLIVRKARIVARALRRDFGITAPRLAVAGLNPHAGEGGQFGDEERRVIEPAIAALRDQGLSVIGPIPGDALFTPMVRSSYDAALCMYHDQALIPLKALEFDEGVNVTLGLPIIRTSPDHGTAFDIAGHGRADPGAMIAAIRMAVACARARAGG